MKHYRKNPTNEEIEWIANNLRPEDIDEIKASTCSDNIYGVIKKSLELSDETYAVINSDGKAVGVFGIRSHEGDGIPWLLTTREIEKFKRQFKIQSQEIVNEWLNKWPYLYNYVDCRNKVAIKWLKTIGFKMEDTFTLGDPHVPFFKFTQAKNV